MDPVIKNAIEQGKKAKYGLDTAIEQKHRALQAKQDAEIESYMNEAREWARSRLPNLIKEAVEKGLSEINLGRGPRHGAWGFKLYETRNAHLEAKIRAAGEMEGLHAYTLSHNSKYSSDGCPIESYLNYMITWKE